MGAGSAAAGSAAAAAVTAADDDGGGDDDDDGGGGGPSTPGWRFPRIDGDFPESEAGEEEQEEVAGVGVR
jgi:hypothetical protein